MRRIPMLILMAVASATLGSCTAKYQDLLRDRDTTIRELTEDLAEQRAANADLARRERLARGEVDSLRNQLNTTPEPAQEVDDLGGLRSELADLDVRYSRGRVSIGIENTVTFASGSSDLKSTADGVLRRVADVLRRRFPERRIYVEGHTDTDPIRKSSFRTNRHLSAERADAVADHLVRVGGIDPSQVVIVGFGPNDPVDGGGGEQAKARNRRVEIVVGDPL